MLSANNVLYGRVTAITPRLLDSLVSIEVCGSAWTINMPADELHARGLRIGNRIKTLVKACDAGVSVTLASAGCTRSRSVLINSDT